MRKPEAFRTIIAGTDWYGDDRESLNDLAKYYNNAHLSDVNLVIGEEM